MEDNYGRMEIRLNELLKEKGLSKNKLSHKAEMNWEKSNSCLFIQGIKSLGWVIKIYH